jgi:hypothetical protein
MLWLFYTDLPCKHRSSLAPRDQTPHSAGSGVERWPVAKDQQYWKHSEEEPKIVHNRYRTRIVLESISILGFFFKNLEEF